MSEKVFKDELDENIDHLTNKNQQQETAKDKKEINLDDVFLDFTQDVPDPIVLLSQEGTNATIFTEGNLSLILGKSKSRKTTLVVALCVALLGKKTINMETHGDNYTVVIVDTEQGLNFAYKTGRKVLRMMGWNDHENSERFKYADLRKYDQAMRLKIIKEIVDTLHPTVMFIDGIVDLCGDFNDQKASSDVIQKLMEMAAESKTHICCCLHFNKDGKTERGHLGAMYMQKCETTFAAIYESDRTSKCEPYEGGCRHLHFKEFYFTMDENGIPELVELPQDKVQPASKDEKAMKYIASVFDANNYVPMRYNDLVRGIQDVALADGINTVAERTAKKYIKDMVESGFIIKSGDGRNMIYLMPGHDKNKGQQREFGDDDDSTNAIGEPLDHCDF